MLAGSSEELAQSRNLIKLCLDQIQKESLDSFDLALSTKKFKMQMKTGYMKLLLDFVKMYCQELMVNFGEQLMLILDNQGVKQEGELTKEEKKKLETLNAA